jgi:acyl-CoA thioesterase-1
MRFKSLLARLLLAAVLTAGGRAVSAAGGTIVALGDSLTAGYGLPAEAAFPAQLEAYLRARGLDWRVVNAGVSGDTSAGGLARLDWALADRPAIVLVELGANDGLRGLSVVAMEANLERILATLMEKGITPVLAGMRAPPNLGPDYAEAFAAVFPRLAAKHGVAFDPFFLEGVAAEPALNQADGIHPTAAGVARIVARLGPLIERVIAERHASRAGAAGSGS